MIFFELNIGKRGSRINVFGIVDPILKRADFSALSNFELRDLVIDPVKDLGRVIEFIRSFRKSFRRELMDFKNGTGF